MMYIRKIAKFATIALVVCMLLFSVINAQAAMGIPIISFNPIPVIIPTIPLLTLNTDFFFFTPPPSDSSSLVLFTDTKLRDALIIELGVNVNQLTENYLGSLTGTLDLSSKGIEKLGGIEALDNIDYLILRDNPISSRHELKRLRLLNNLESLDISALSVTQIPSELGDLTNLKFLDISANRIDSLPSALSDLNLDVLLCNYCFFDIENDTGLLNTIIAATSAADYQYQLNKIDIYGICQTAGTVTIKWDELPDIVFPNGAIAQIQRYSISKPNPSGNQGAYLDSESRSSTSYTFDELDPSKTYSFDISADYHIKNTIYDGKYIKFYEKELFRPIPQDTPTPSPTFTPEATIALESTPTVAPSEVALDVTQAPVDIVTINPNQPVDGSQSDNSNSKDSMFTMLIVLVIVLIVAIVGLFAVLFVKMNNQGGSSPPAPPRS